MHANIFWFFLITFLAIASVVVILILMAVISLGRRNNRTRKSVNRQMDGNQRLYSDMNDMNLNGVPDSWEVNQKDSDHDGIPDYIDHDPYSGNNDYSSDDIATAGYSSSNMDSGSMDTGSFDLSNTDSGGFDSSNTDSGGFDTGGFDTGSFDSGSN